MDPLAFSDSLPSHMLQELKTYSVIKYEQSYLCHTHQYWSDEALHLFIKGALSINQAC